MKKSVKVISIILVILVGVVVLQDWVVNVIFHDRILTEIELLLNENIESQVSFKDARLSTLRNFPTATITVDSLVISEGSHRILSASEIALQLNLFDLLEEHYIFNRVELDGAEFNVFIDSLGGKHMIKGTAHPDKASRAFMLHIPEISIVNASIIVTNAFKKNHMRISIDEGLFNMRSSSDLISFEGDALGTLDTLVNKGKLMVTDVKVAAENSAFRIGQVDRRNFFDGVLKLGEAHVKVDGVLKPVSNGNIMDVTLEGAEADLNNYLALIPNMKSFHFKQTNPDARLTFRLKVTGYVDPVSYPSMDMDFKLNYANFAKVGSPYVIRDVYVNGAYSNGEEKGPKTSYLVIKNGEARIEESFVQLFGSLVNFEDPMIDLDLQTELNLKELNEIFTLPKVAHLEGLVRVKMDLEGKLSDRENFTDMSTRHFNGLIEFINVNGAADSLTFVMNDLNGKVEVLNENIRFDHIRGKLNGSTFGLNGLVDNFFPLINDSSANISQADLVIDLDEFDIPKTLKEPDQIPDTLGFDYSFFPKNLNLGLKLSSKRIGFGDINIERVTMGVKMNADSVLLRRFHFWFRNGEIRMRGAGHFKNGINVRNEVSFDADFRYLNIDTLMTQALPKSAKPKEGFSIPENLYLLANIDVDKLIYHGKVFNHIDLMATYKRHNLNIDHINVGFDFGRLSSAWKISDLDTKPVLDGHARLTLDTVDIITMRAYYADLIPKKDSAKEKKARKFEIKDVDIHVSSPMIRHKKIAVTDFVTDLVLYNENMKLTQANFGLFGGEFKLTGLLEHSDTVHVMSTARLSAKNIHASQVVASLPNTENMISADHVKGILEVDGLLILSYDENLVHQQKDMIGRIKLKLDDGELIDFKPITHSLKFLKKSTLDTIFMANQEIDVLFHNDEILVPSTVFSSNVTNIEFMGYHNNEVNLGFNLRVSVSDLLKSEKKKKAKVGARAAVKGINYYLSARTIDDELQVDPLKRKEYFWHQKLLDTRYKQIDVILNYKLETYRAQGITLP
ncbi:hypothetical protein [Reichenbachiella agariperforans]|uniref:hypothetical protein n=1 Tax=Reichenbachiella agariperforans TaxID=156994 RepID=UPI001C0A08F5|nr:hypothetical protein [Reichenbachiella agariperforans]MBU2916092.1 hypothetical protein [Reichenbachiella agariperforans]